jgi:hypothetical protein
VGLLGAATPAVGLNVDIDRIAGEETLSRIKKNGGEGLLIHADVSKSV